jgi:hypothetical protein
MAIYKNGKMSGKLGDVIHSSWHGRHYTRRKPETVANPQTESQQAHRNAFAEISRLSSAMKTGHQEGLHWQAVRQKLNTHSVFKKLNKNCYGPNGIDYPRVKISEGSVSRANITYAKIDAEGNISVLFDGRANETEDLKDQFFLYVFCPALRDGAFAKPVNRSEEAVSCQIPDEWRGHDLHLYAFMKDKVGHTSDTIYVGAFK